jgi:hypothetical protein
MEPTRSTTAHGSFLKRWVLINAAGTIWRAATDAEADRDQDGPITKPSSRLTKLPLLSTL